MTPRVAKIYTVWATPRADEFTLVEGETPPPWEAPDLVRVRTLAAPTWDAARRQYAAYVESLPPLVPR